MAGISADFKWRGKDAKAEIMFVFSHAGKDNNQPTENLLSSTKEMQSPALGRKTPMHQYSLGMKWV